MRMINRKAFFAAVLFQCMLAPVYADDTSCIAGNTCAPCGNVCMNNLPNIPTDAPGVNPLLNYSATLETCRRYGYFSGPYIGAAYGLGDINYHLNVAGNTPFGLDNDARSYHQTVGYVGYNLVLQYFSLAAEVGYNYRSRNNPISYDDEVDFIVASGIDPVLDSPIFVSTEPCKVRLDINSQHALTADIMPGFVYSRFIAYFRLGVEEAQYAWNRRVCIPAITLNNTVDPPTLAINNLELSDAQHKTARGYRLGTGFGFAAGAHVSFYLNYVHTFGEKLTFTPNTTGFAAANPVLVINGGTVNTVVSLSQLAGNVLIEPQRDEVTFGVRFRF